MTAVAFIATAVYFSRTVTGFLKSEAVRMARTKEAAAARKAAWARLETQVARELKGLNGKAGVIIKDLGSDREIAVNEDLQMPSASMVKIPIMMSYFFAAREGRLSLSDRIAIKKSDKAPGSGTLKYDIPGKEYTIEELIIRMVTESDNTATNMLINNMGFAALNAYFDKLGLKHTNLSRKMMDFRERKSGVENYTTAGDMAYLLERLYRGKFLSEETSRQCIEILARQKMKDRIPKRLPHEVVVAHKTGLENGLCHDAGIVYTDKGDFLICVLIKHRNKTARDAKSVIAEIALFVYNLSEHNNN